MLFLPFLPPCKMLVSSKTLELSPTSDFNDRWFFLFLQIFRHSIYFKKYLTFLIRPNNEQEQVIIRYYYDKGGLIMLGTWRSHDDYQRQLVKNLTTLTQTNPHALLEYEKIISKLFILNFDPLHTIIKHLYSVTGRKSKSQPEIFRAFILMNHLGLSLDQWIHKVKFNAVLRIAAGFDSDTLPAIASYYDFITRIIRFDEKPRSKY